MIKNTDIKRAISLFKEWDNLNKWDNPDELFIKHTLSKSEDAINTAKALLKIMKDKELQLRTIEKEFNASLWIINSSYYSMFFLAEVLLAKENRKLPNGTEDSHKTIFLALLYYYIIKGSDTESKKDIKWEDITKTRLSEAIIMLESARKDSAELMQIKRAKEAIESYGNELFKRNELTYRSSKNVEIAIAEKSIERADKFWEIINEYLIVKNKPLYD
jgi:uncharacterized protein (UPF0332 family)